jgi:hypothetical protein
VAALSLVLINFSPGRQEGCCWFEMMFEGERMLVEMSQRASSASICHFRSSKKAVMLVRDGIKGAEVLLNEF